MLPKIKTILYATGLGPGAPYVFRYALALARQHQANIIAIHAMEPLTPFGQSLVEQYISHDTSEEIHQKAREAVKAQLEQKIKELCQNECNGSPDCRNLLAATRVIEGYPSQTIIDMAREYSADLIVMGAHHHTRVGEFVLGGTTRQVLHISELPVFVVKIPMDQKEELQ
jgi:nucleotide-binding universal stress UspA family protein